VTDKEISTVLEEIERKRYFSMLQASAEEKGEIPRMPFLLMRKFRRPLQYIGGFLVACAAGLFSILLNFIIFVRILHLQY
jgi:hypothetical protein